LSQPEMFESCQLDGRSSNLALKLWVFRLLDQ
jgi:hypothetical protein